MAMNTLLAWLFSSTGRRYIYSVALGIIVILVGYHFLTEEQAALWTTLLTALLALAPATALAHITPDVKPPAQNAPDPGRGGYADDPRDGMLG